MENLRIKWQKFEKVIISPSWIGVWRSPVSVHVWGACGRRFKSCHPDKLRFQTLLNPCKSLIYRDFSFWGIAKNTHFIQCSGVQFGEQNFSREILLTRSTVKHWISLIYELMKLPIFGLFFGPKTGVFFYWHFSNYDFWKGCNQKAL